MRVNKPNGLIDEVSAHLAELDRETLRRDQAELEKKRQEEERAKALVAKALQARSFADRLWVLGIGFAVLIAVLPPNSNKPVLYVCAFATVLIGALWRDRENRTVAKLLPLVPSEDLGLEEITISGRRRKKSSKKSDGPR